jgi:cytochrome c biogenesis protein CcdA
MDIHLPTLGIVLGSAAIDSINPCGIGVLILMVSVMLSAKKSAGQMLYLGGLYILAIFLTYLLAGLGLLYFLSSVPLKTAEYVSLTVGSLVVLAGLIEIKDYFWYGRGISLAIPVGLSKKIHNFAQNTTALGVILAGVFVAAVELPCTGAPYLAVITILSINFDLAAMLLLVIYNIIFVSPLIIILLLVAGGTKLHLVKNWKQESRGGMRMMMGLLLIVLGWLLILLSNGTINLG